MVTRQAPAAPPAQPPAAPPAQRPATQPQRIRPKPKKKVMGEEALMEFGSARKSTHYIMRYVITLVLLVIGIYTMISPGIFAFIEFLFPGMYISLGFIIAGLAMLLWSEMDMKYTGYAITPTRVIENIGILKKKTVAVNINMITGTRVHQSLPDRILGVGDLEINTHYKEHALILRYINDPMEKEAYILQMQSGRAAPQQPQAPPTPPPAAPPATPPAAPPAQPPQRQPGY